MEGAEMRKEKEEEEEPIFRKRAGRGKRVPAKVRIEGADSGEGEKGSEEGRRERMDGSTLDQTEGEAKNVDEGGEELGGEEEKKENKEGREGERKEEGEGEERGEGLGDEEMSLSDLIALRSLHKKPVGIDLQRLNKGEKKKKKKKTSSTPKTAEEKWAEQLAKGGLVSREMEDDEDAEEGEAEATQSKRIVRQNNFQGETGTLDVDKHMMAYIEEEMRKRRGGEDLGSLPTASQVKASFNNPEDELYQVAEKYRQLQNKNKTDLDKEEEEGNVTLSASMLSSIPEIDLGMDARLKNIEETEKAKRAFYESRKAGGGEMRRHEDDQLAAARFFRPRYQARSDADASRVSRAFPNGPSAAAATSSNQAGEGGGARRKVDRREMASDQLVMDRFKKRQRNFK